MKKVIIGVLANNLVYQNNSFTEIEKQYVNDSYIMAVEKNGGIPIIIPYLNDEEEVHNIIDLCDGLLCPGGEDVNPRLYNENPHARLGEIKPSVDEFIYKAIDYAVKKNMPILGICKGMQMLNVYMGGSLYQDLSQRDCESFLHVQHQKRDYGVHKVKIDKNSNLYNILKAEEVYTNSLHHQAAKHIGNNLACVAQTEDGVVEAIESKDGLIIGVQWHPEEMQQSEPLMRSLFKNLIEKSQKK